MPDITREQAEVAARQAIAEAARLDIVDGDQWPDDRTAPRTYGSPSDFPAGHWVVRLVGDGTTLGSGHYITVRKRDGLVTGPFTWGE